MLFYFQGGGACWDKASTELGLCSTSASGDSNIGVFCRDSDSCTGDNPFMDYTIVQVLYCSGDAHIGQVVRDYSAHDRNGENVSQQGGEKQRGAKRRAGNATIKVVNEAP